MSIITVTDSMDLPVELAEMVLNQPAYRWGCYVAGLPESLPPHDHVTPGT